ncbi:hypothetical protein AD940_00535 [Gluconobacter thailandicus]|uniref:hypothetical protein n=1 Tax=Gluconobacter thailandicus TaxID=257438 RepID=UPI0007777CC4|nr:hypothetical protein [Gluconobacter thailandicus]KXV36127.1 hypothetical protein AD940_00535 [Gluconobacter thailandicus]
MGRSPPDQALSIGTVVPGDVTVKSVFRPVLLLGVTLSVTFGAVHARPDIADLKRERRLRPKPGLLRLA